MSYSQIIELNQMELNYESILCYLCMECLTAPIYICNDEKNYCELCAEQLTMEKIRNCSLENLLKNLIYQCNYCYNYNARQAKVLQHKEVCSEHPIESNCCKKKLQPQSMQRHLVDKHSMKKINVSDNVAIIQLTTNLEKTLFWETKLNDKTFIIRIISTTDSFQVNVATNGSDVDNETPFFVNCFTQGITGQVIDYRTMFDKSAVVAGKATAKLDMPTAGEIKLQIIFGQEKVSNVNINECLICMHRLTEKVFLCCNRHMICNNCKPKISHCPTCQEPMGDAFFNLSNLIPDYIIPCPNSEDGCLHRFPENELATHQLNCKYNLKVECTECHKMIPNCKLSAHRYKCYFKNERDRNEFFYTHDNKQIFVWAETIKGNNAYYNVRMPFANASEASKFGFKILYYEDREDVLAKYAVTGICQAGSDYSNVFAIPNADNIENKMITIYEI